MKKLIAALALSGAFVAAAPAGAVAITGTSALDGNIVTPFETSASQISVDFDLHQFSPITVDFAVETGDAGSYNFDSFVNIFTGVDIGYGVDFLTFSLTDGATFDMGDVSSAFSSAVASLNGAGNELTLRFTPSEYILAQLGSADGTAGDFLINGNGLASGQGFSLIVSAGAVPEPATWAMMIAGFGLVGGAMRTRLRNTVRAAA